MREKNKTKSKVERYGHGVHKKESRVQTQKKSRRSGRKEDVDKEWKGTETIGESISRKAELTVFLNFIRYEEKLFRFELI